MRSVTLFAVALLLACTTYAVGLTAQAPSAASQPAATPTASLININTATAGQLEQLPGVGPRTAALIVEYRQKHGPFKKTEELMNVKGLGEKSFLRIKTRVSVGAPKPDVS